MGRDDVPGRRAPSSGVRMHIADLIPFIAPALVPNSRFETPYATWDGTELSAWNGVVYAHLPCELDLPPFVVDGARLKSLVTTTSRVSVADKMVTVINGTTRYALKKADDKRERDAFVPLDSAATSLPEGFVDAVKQVAPFASSNAIHLWATCVIVTERGMIATNNAALAFVPYESAFNFTLPVSMVPELRVGVHFKLGAGAVETHDPKTGLTLRFLRLATEAPAQVFKLVEELPVCTTPVGDLKTIVADLDKISTAAGSTTVTIENNEITLTNSKGDWASHPFTEALRFKTGIEGMRLAAACATHLSDQLCPNKLLFSNSTLRGVLAGRTDV